MASRHDPFRRTSASDCLWFLHGTIEPTTNDDGWTLIALDMKEAVMTDPRFRDNEYVRSAEALSGTAWVWILSVGAAVFIGLLIIVSYSDTMNTASNTSTSPAATSNAPPRIPPSTTGSGAQPEQPSQYKPGG